MRLYSVDIKLYTWCSVINCRGLTNVHTIFYIFGVSKNRSPPQRHLHLPTQSPHYTASTTSGKPVKPHCAGKEAGLKELLEQWPSNKISILVGSNWDAEVRAEGCGVGGTSEDNREDSRPHTLTKKRMPRSQQASAESMVFDQCAGGSGGCSV